MAVDIRVNTSKRAGGHRSRSRSRSMPVARSSRMRNLTTYLVSRPRCCSVRQIVALLCDLATMDLSTFITHNDWEVAGELALPPRDAGFVDPSSLPLAAKPAAFLARRHP